MAAAVLRTLVTTLPDSDLLPFTAGMTRLLRASLEMACDAGRLLQQWLSSPHPPVHHRAVRPHRAPHNACKVLKHSGIPERSFFTGQVVRAAGAWLDVILEASGFEPVGLKPLRRHLFQTARRRPRIRPPHFMAGERRCVCEPSPVASWPPCDEMPVLPTIP